MSWLLVSLNHQQPWHSIRSIMGRFTLKREDFEYLQYFLDDNCKHILVFTQIISESQGSLDFLPYLTGIKVMTGWWTAWINLLRWFIGHLSTLNFILHNVYTGASSPILLFYHRFYHCHWCRLYCHHVCKHQHFVDLIWLWLKNGFFCPNSYFVERAYPFCNGIGVCALRLLCYNKWSSLRLWIVQITCNIKVMSQILTIVYFKTILYSTTIMLVKWLLDS